MGFIGCGVIQLYMNNMKKKSNVLITGINGFIGTNLKRRLDKDYNVYSLDRGIYSDIQKLRSKVKEINPLYIFNTMAYGNHYDQLDLNEMIGVNIMKTYLLLSACIDIDYNAFIQFGTSSEYGIKHEKMSENMVPETGTMYGATKVGATYISRAFALNYTKPIVIVRPFSVYGPLDSEKHFVPVVINSLLNDRKFELDPKPMHDWLYIDDFINALVIVAGQAENMRGNIINIGSGIQHSNKSVVKRLEKIHGGKAKYTATERIRVYDSSMWVANNDYLLSLGWKQENTLNDGLEKTYNYAKSRLKA